MPRKNKTKPTVAKSESKQLDEDLARLEVRCSPKLLNTSLVDPLSHFLLASPAGCSQVENAEMEAKLKLSSRESYRAAEPPSLATSDSANLDEDIARLEVRPRQ